MTFALRTKRLLSSTWKTLPRGLRESTGKASSSPPGSAGVVLFCPSVDTNDMAEKLEMDLKRRVGGLREGKNLSTVRKVISLVHVPAEQKEESQRYQAT